VPAQLPDRDPHAHAWLRRVLTALTVLVFLFIIGAAVLSAAACGGGAGRAPKYRDADLPIAERVDDLIGRMTLEEKVSQLVHGAAPIERLDVPAYNWWNEGLHGVARAGLATVFPQAIGLAATWDEPLMKQVASVISEEARAKHHEAARRGKRDLYQGLTFWSPNINIFRDPRWGRGMETYGEDPYLAGRLAVAFVKGMQGDDPRYLKTVATPKHYAVHSGPESTRHTFDAVIDERDLRDTYLPQFELAVREGGALSVMCAYNRLFGEPCCASPRLLDTILRKEWGFGGYVVSDCDAVDDIFKTHKSAPGAPQAAAMALRAGCDLNCGEVFKSLAAAVQQRLVTGAEVDRALRRLFTIRFRLGMFDPPARVRYASIPLSVVDRPEHQAVALQAARESIVLLKNDNNTLPLRRGIRTVAVIGPNADDVEVLLGNYNGTPSKPVTPLQGIRAKLAGKAKVLYARGAEWAYTLPALDPVPSSALSVVEHGKRVSGLKGEYFTLPDTRRQGAGAAGPASWLSSSIEFPTLEGQPDFTRIDPQIDFNWWDGAPDPRMNDDDNFAVRWTGEMAPPVSGMYALGAVGLTGFRLWVDGKQVVEYKSCHEPSKQSAWLQLEAGRRYPIRFEYFQRMRNAHVTLLWRVPGRDLRREAMAAVKRADAVVLVLGLSPRLEGEEMKVAVPGFAGGDRVDIGLPAVQEDLLKAVQAAGKPTVLALMNGSALALPWADQHVPAIVEAWYPGQAAGAALADVLFGDYSPSGRLAVTFYRSVDQLPPFDTYDMAGRTYRYFTQTPLYPFGHGLSYTSFSYANLSMPASVRAGEAVPVSVDVTNAGRVAGDEVVQLYVRDVEASVRVPVRALAGFARVTLAPGETRRVSFTLAPRALSIVDKTSRRVIEPGVFEIAVGGKQPGFTGHADARTTAVVIGRLQVTGTAVVGTEATKG
jgi:beta-glucosidase